MINTISRLINPVGNYRVLLWRSQLTTFPAMTTLTPCFNFADISQRKLLIKSLAFYFYSSAGGNANQFVGALDTLTQTLDQEDAYTPAGNNDYFTGGYNAILKAGSSIVNIGDVGTFPVPIQQNKYDDLYIMTDSPLTEDLSMQVTAQLKGATPFVNDDAPFCKVVMEAYVMSEKMPGYDRQDVY